MMAQSRRCRHECDDSPAEMLGPGRDNLTKILRFYKRRRKTTMSDADSPYTPPAPVAFPVHNAMNAPQAPLLPVAIGILVPSLLFVFGALFYFVYVYSLTNSRVGDPSRHDSLKVYAMYQGISMVYSLLLVSGAICMMRRQSYMWSLSVCILALFPIAGCYVVVLPFGIWGIKILRRPDVRASFSSL